MDKTTFDSLKLQYEEGARIIRYWIETRYKILQFVGYFNAAVLTFGFSQNILLSEEKAIAGVAICVLSVFVSLMGLATEFSVSSYNYGYFEALRNIEKRIGDEKDIGIITHSRETIIKNRFHEILPVHRAHKLFYSLLIVFWIIILIYQLAL